MIKQQVQQVEKMQQLLAANKCEEVVATRVEVEA